MKKLTEEQFNALNADQWIVTNLRYTLSGFKRQTSTKENDIVFDIYDEISGNKNYRNYSCPNCLYKAFSAVAKAYFSYTPTNDEKPNEEVAQSAPSDDITTDEVTEPKKPASKTVKKSTAKKKSAKKKSSKSAEQQRLRSKTK